MGCTVIHAVMRTSYVRGTVWGSLDKTQPIHAPFPHKEGRKMEVLTWGSREEGQLYLTDYRHHLLLMDYTTF